MIMRLLMRIDNILIFFSIIFLFMVACTKIETTYVEDSCKLFQNKKNWYKATKSSYEKWQATISLQLAIINQESSFNQFAKPKRNKIFGIIPSSRPSTAFGYAQVTNPTWNWYKTRTNNTNYSPYLFVDIFYVY